MCLFQKTQHHNEPYGREGKKTNTHNAGLKRCPLKLIKHFAKHDLHFAICRSNGQPSSERSKFNQSFRVYVDFLGERSGSVVECWTRDQRAPGASLTDVSALWFLSKTHLS